LRSTRRCQTIKITYEFNEDDEAKRALFEKAQDFYSALWNIANTIRDFRKYEVSSPEQVIEAVHGIVVDSGLWEIE